MITLSGIYSLFQKRPTNNNSNPKNNQECYEPERFIENEKKVYQSWAERNKQDITWLNPNKRSKITQKYFPVRDLTNIQNNL